MIKASGCLFLSVDTGRVLLQQRSGSVNHPRTWAFFGGKAEWRTDDKDYPVAVPVYVSGRPQQVEIGDTVHAQVWIDGKHMRMKASLQKNSG